MGMERCGKFMKWSLFGFNFLILVAGCTLLAIGIYTRAHKDGLSNISAILGNQLYSTFSLGLIIIGCLIILISFFGCCGAIKEVRCMLGAFFVLLLVIFTALLIGGIVAYAFRNDLSKFAKTQMHNSLNSSYGMKDSEPITAAWDSIQQIFNCCGVEGNENSSYSWAFYKHHSAWFREQPDNIRNTKFIPQSCCLKVTLPTDRKPKASYIESEYQQCQSPDKKAPRLGPPIVLDYREGNRFYKNGCYTAIVKFIQENAIIIGSVAVGIAVIMILGMVFSLCLCRAIREEYELGETYCPPP